MKGTGKVVFVVDDTGAIIAGILVPQAFTERDLEEAQKLNTWGQTLYLQNNPPDVIRLDTPQDINQWIESKMKEIG